jgi:thermitase
MGQNKKREKRFSGIVVGLAVFFGMGVAATATIRSFAALPGAQARHVPGEIVIKLKGGKGSQRFHLAGLLRALEERLGTRAVVDVRDFKTDATMHTLKLARDADLDDAIDALHAQDGVEIAEPNQIFRISHSAQLPNDPSLFKTWGLHNTGQTDASGQIGKAGSDVNVLPLWNEGIRGSRKVVVAVIDTGIDWEHPDLKANLYTNPGESGALAENGKDDDGNGFVDDLHGWNFDAKSRDSNDDHDHGTHCSGTIGAVGNNGTGVAGVNWQVSLMPIKFLDGNGSGSLEGAVEAINYATLMKVNVMSNSWGGGEYTESLFQAIKNARDAGILFVAAAGNDSSNNDQHPSFPASYELDNILTVAATDNRDGLAGFSNFGSRSVHLAAPGVKVFSTTKGGKYDFMSGTSMAAPHVSGIAALLLGEHPEWKYLEVKDRLITTSDPVRGLKHRVLAKGRVNAFNALHGIIPETHEPDASLWRSEPELVESEHPYKNRDNLTFKIQHKGAKFLRVHFEKVEVENNYDKVLIQDAAGVETIDQVTGTVADYTSEYIEGDTLTIRLKADESNAGYGFKVDKIEVIY